VRGLIPRRHSAGEAAGIDNSRLRRIWEESSLGFAAPAAVAGMPP
jgi:hypothetical protein